MNPPAITIQSSGRTDLACRCAVVVPDSALAEIGHISTRTTDSSAHAKHQLHALTQMALFDFQEGELKPQAAAGPITIRWQDETTALPAGLVLCLDLQGDLHLVANTGLNVGKLLQLAHRFTTRWIRLDI